VIGHNYFCRDNMSSIDIVSPPMSSGRPTTYKCFVEANNQLCEVEWQGDSKHPNFNGLPLRRVELSSEMKSTWSRTRHLAYGANAFVRTFDEGPFPVVKIAQPSAQSRLYIRHEWAFLQRVRHLPNVVKFHPEPLVDGEGIYGFRMEKLSKIDFQNLAARYEEVREAMRNLHSHGFCHGDLNPSNVMVNEEGEVVLIDFAFAGVIGERLPGYAQVGVLWWEGV